MSTIDARALRAIRSASFNNEMVVELLQEISPLTDDADLCRRLRCAARQLQRDADALENVWLELILDGEQPAVYPRHP